MGYYAKSDGVGVFHSFFIFDLEGSDLRAFVPENGDLRETVKKVHTSDGSLSMGPGS